MLNVYHYHHIYWNETQMEYETSLRILQTWKRLKGVIGNEPEPYIEYISLPPYLLKHETNEIGNQPTDALQNER